LRELSEKIVDTVLSVRLREESVLAVEEIIKNPVGYGDTRIVAFPRPVEVKQPPYEPKQQVSFLHLEPVVEKRVVACMKFCEGFSSEKLEELGSLRAALPQDRT